jgi:hypothetical protein
MLDSAVLPEKQPWMTLGTLHCNIALGAAEPACPARWGASSEFLAPLDSIRAVAGVDP